MKKIVALILTFGLVAGISFPSIGCSKKEEPKKTEPKKEEPKKEEPKKEEPKMP